MVFVVGGCVGGWEGTSVPPPAPAPAPPARAPASKPAAAAPSTTTNALVWRCRSPHPLLGGRACDSHVERGKAVGVAQPRVRTALQQRHRRAVEAFVIKVK